MTIILHNYQLYFFLNDVQHFFHDAVSDNILQHGWKHIACNFKLLQAPGCLKAMKLLL